MSSFSPRQMFLLDEACKPIAEAFDEIPYLVGTAAARKRQSYRDVDVRMIMDDEKYDSLAKAAGQNVITFLGLAIGEYLHSRTGLPIDFQIQRMTEANERHGTKGTNKTRNALGMRSIENYSGDAAP